MKLSNNMILIIFGILALGIMAIVPLTLVAAQVLNPKPDVDPQATIQAMVTQALGAMTPTPTSTPLPPTPAPIYIPVTVTPVPTSTAAPTSVPVTYCDWVAFIKDVTVPDGSAFNVNESFTKTWRLKNRGTCTWTPD